MELLVEKTDKIKGVIKAPPSKSYTHRALLISSLAQGKSHLKDPLYSADTMASLEACQSLGCNINVQNNSCLVTGTGGELTTPEDVLDLKNSGTTLRFLTTMSSLAPGCSILTGDKSLRRRPMQDLLDSLGKLGIHAYSTRNNGLPPIVVKNGFKGGKTSISGKVSSQYLSSLLISAPYAEKAVEIQVVDDFISQPYVEMTIDSMQKFGVQVSRPKSRSFLVEKQIYHGRDYTIEGDYSSTSYLIAAAAALEGNITLKNLFPDSKQGDKIILDIVQKMGAKIKQRQDQVSIQGNGHLKGVDVSLNNSPDLLPTVAALAAVAEGTSHIKGVKHARYKETDRIHTMAQELTKLGVKLTEEPDGLIIRGGAKSGRVESHGDHRLVMALTIVGLVTGGVHIKNAAVHQVSFPQFIQTMQKMGCKLKSRSNQSSRK
jgi:3-phosphoshikimate 1-carboxyvinyltransferase